MSMPPRLRRQIQLHRRLPILSPHPLHLFAHRSLRCFHLVPSRVGSAQILVRSTPSARTTLRRDTYPARRISHCAAIGRAAHGQTAENRHAHPNASAGRLVCRGTTNGFHHVRRSAKEF